MRPRLESTPVGLRITPGRPRRGGCVFAHPCLIAHGCNPVEFTRRPRKGAETVLYQITCASQVVRPGSAYTPSPAYPARRRPRLSRETRVGLRVLGECSQEPKVPGDALLAQVGQSHGAEVCAR
jgi:hypothetical protein